MISLDILFCNSPYFNLPNSISVQANTGILDSYFMGIGITPSDDILWRISFQPK